MGKYTVRYTYARGHHLYDRDYNLTIEHDTDEQAIMYLDELLDSLDDQSIMGTLSLMDGNRLVFHREYYSLLPREVKCPPS